jgi:RNA polymerase sigma factor (sigma-70 family)
MAVGGGGAGSRPLQALFSVGTFGGLSDGQLLDRFALGHGEAGELAFAVLVERHGPMVLRVCRSVLHDEHDAEDAFQATFLVLSRRYGSLRVSESIGPWLYGVARRVASAARLAADRRRRHERRAAELAPSLVVSLEGDIELERSLHDEIDRLPERYRVPVVLCLLEGLTHEQAARQLGWPVGTVKSRLAHARETLRSRLVRLGLAPAAVLSGTMSGRRSAPAAIPGPLVGATAGAAVRLATGGPAAGVVPARAAALVARVQRSMFMIQASVMAAVLALVSLGLSPGDTGTKGRPVSGLKFTFVDLQPKGNHKLSETLGDFPGNNLAKLAQGVQDLRGTWYQVGERLIRVRGRRSPEPPARKVDRLESEILQLSEEVQIPEPPAPEAVRGIPIDARFDALHILHSTRFGRDVGVADGTEIGVYLLRYADGSEERIPIVYGADVRDWWRSADPALPSRARLAWSNPNEATGPDNEVRLFSSRWANPHPEKKVLTIDFETRNAACAPFLVALTLERTLYGRGDDAGH